MDEIPSHTCSLEELGIEGNDSSFFALAERQAATIKTYQKKFKCLDRDELYVSGEFNSEKAALINMRLVRCEETETQKCKSNDEITAFFRDKYLLLLFNEKYFDSNQYEESSIVSAARVKWFTINTQVQQQIPMQITKSQIFLQDKNVDLDDLTEIYDNSIFSL